MAEIIDINDITSSRRASDNCIVISEIFDLLLHLGIGIRYQGFRQCAYAIILCLKKPEDLTLVTKRLYPEVGKRFGVSAAVIERNLRAVTNLAWESNPEFLKILSGNLRLKKPTTSEFLEIVSSYFSHSPLPSEHCIQQQFPQ